MKKKLLSFLLAALMVLSMVPMALFVSTAAPVSLDADDLYVTDGLKVWLNAFDKTEAEAAITAGKWTSKVGTDIQAEIKGGAYSAENPTGWKVGANGGLKWTLTTVDQKENGIYLDPSLIPTGNWTAQIISAVNGRTNAEETERIVDDYNSTNKTGATYGYGHPDAIQIGIFRSYSFRTVHTKDGGGSADTLGNRWFITALEYSEHYTSFGSAKPGINLGNEVAARNHAINTPFDMTITWTRINETSVGLNIMENGTSLKTGENGSFKRTITSKNISLAEDAAFPANNSAKTNRLQFAVGMPGIVFAIRLYDRVLTEDEINQNHFADIANYFGLDVSNLADKDAATCRLIFTAFSAYTFEDETKKAEMQKIIDDAKVAAPDMTVYDKLYVQDGLTVLLSAFDSSDSSVKLSEGRWLSKITGGEFAKLENDSDIIWKAGNNGGLRYDAGRQSSAMLNLGIGLLPKGDYTLEVIADVIGVTKDGDGKTQYSHDTRYGLETALPFVIGPLRAEGWPSLRYFQDTDQGDTVAKDQDDFAKNELRWLYRDGTNGWGSAGANPWSFQQDHALQWSGAAFTWTLVHDLNDAGDTSTYTIMRDNASLWSRNTADKKVTEAFIPVNDSQPFYLFKSFPAEVYAVRIYNRVLSAEEQTWNHFVDMLAYYKTDISEGSAYSKLTEAQLSSLVSTTSVKAVGAYTAEEFNGMIELIVRNAEIAAENITDADKLYVTDGLSVLLTAYHANDEMLNIANGTWLNKVDGATMFLRGSLWTKGENGVSFAMDKAKWSAEGANTYLDLGGAPVTDDWTMELIANIKGLTNEDGSYFVDPDKNWGTYATGYSSIEIGWVKGTSFVCASPAQAGSGQLATRISYQGGHWGVDNGKYWLGGSMYYWGVAPAGNGNKNEVRDQIINLTMTKVVDEFTRTMTLYKELGKRENKVGEITQTLKGTEITIFQNGTKMTSANTVTNMVGGPAYDRQFTGKDADGNEITGYGQYYTADEAYHAPGGSFILMRGLPGTVYAVRVYNRMLTEAEKNQNHFADLANYTGLDLSKFHTLSKEQQESFYTDYATTKLDCDAETVAAIQAKLDAAYEAAPGFWTDAYAEAYVQDGLTSLFMAFNPNEDSVDLAAGTWASKVGGLTAAIIGGEYDAETNPVGWRRAEDGSIFYRFHDMKEFYAQSNNVGIVLPDSLVNDTDNLTMEAVFLALGVASEDGVAFPHTGAEGESKWGAYNGMRSAFSFGGAQICHFNYSTGETGNNMNTRVFYATGAWESSGVNGTKFNDAKYFGTKDGMSGKIDSLLLSRVFLGTQDDKGNDNIQVSFKTSLAANTVDNDKTKFGKQIEASKLLQKAEAFVGFPAKVYVIRTYNRTLTDAEVKQNHLVDLLAYCNINMAEYDVLLEENISALADKYASVAIEDADAATLQSDLDAAVAIAKVERIFREALETAKTAVTSAGIDLIAEDTKAGVGSNWMIDEAVVKALVEAGFTVEIGAVVGANATTVTVTRGESAYTAADGCQFVVVYSSEENSSFVNGEAKDGAFSLDALVDADTYGAALQFCGFITLTKDGDSRTAYIGAADSTFLAEKDTVTFTEMAQYYVNAIKLIGKLEVYRLTENKFVKEAFEKAGIEMPVIDLESDSTDFGGEKAEDIYKDAEDAGAMTDKDIKDARENGTLDGTDEVPDGLLISKVRVNDELIYTFQFTTLTDGEVILLLEYVSKYYTLGERALEISIDNYAAETYIFDTSVVNAETGLYEHNLFGLHFEIAAGTHTLTIKAAVDANGDTMRAPEIHNITVVD